MRDFRNLEELRFAPDPEGLTVVAGENGAGKTSLLEAIAYASTLSSFRGSPREALVRSGAERSFVRLEVVNEGRSTLVEIEIAPGQRDRAQCNRQRIRKTSELLETLRVTVFGPEDLALVKGGPQLRRDYIDDALVATDPHRLVTRQTVERVLRQRGTLLRQSGGYASPTTNSTLDVWDAQLAAAGGELVAWREELLRELEPLASEAFNRLTGTDYGLRLVYEPSFEGELGEALKRARADDLRRAVTTVGPHRDDVAITSAGLDARTRLSQGRQRCVTLALRLASHQAVTAASGTPPVLLLDDAFSELDERTNQALFAELPDGQAILTTAGPLPRDAKPAALVEMAFGSIR